MIRAFRSEWLKRKRSFATTLVLGGALFTPAIIIAVRLINHRALPRIYAADSFWLTHWHNCWESMAVFFLPLGAILATSLIVQLEFKSNAWKQVHTLPMNTAVLYVAKLAVILVLMAEFLILFNAGIYASGVIPSLIVPGVPSPKGSFFSLPLLLENARYFVDCLPIVAAQYLIALRSHNALVPIGIGFLGWVAALAAISSKAAVWWPYTYTILNYVKDTPKGAHGEFHGIAATFFVLFTLIGYASFATKTERG